MTISKRRLACPQTILHFWDAIAYVRQQKQIPNFERISSYMKRVHNLSPSDVERQVNFAVRDGLLIIKKSIGCKGSKVGVEQDGYRIPEEDVEKDDHDWYCFECHRGGEMMMCSTCHRVYHSVCIKEDLAGSKLVCSVCKMMKGKSQLKMKKNDLNTLLGYTCIRLKEKTRELHRMPHPDEEKWRHDFLIYKQMDLVTMEDKTRNNEYQRVEDFQADAQNIVHNVVIYYGVHSSIADMARQMLRDCIYDIGEIRRCQDCYRVSNEKVDKFWFCHPCDPPHELVFAKQKGFPYWPAKVIKRENNTYDVRFFGGFHQRAKVEEENVKPITTSLQQLSLKRTTSLNRALDELRRHQQLLEKKSRTTTTTTFTTNTTTTQHTSTLPSTLHSKQATSRPSSSSPSRSRSRSRSYKRTKSTSKLKNNTKENATFKEEEVEDEEEEEEVISHDESPSSSSPKVSRFSDAPTPEDHNVVSSSSQETPVARVSVGTQTHKKLLASLTKEGNSEPAACDCNVKYSKVFRDFRERLETEHKEDKSRALRELAEKLQKEFDEEKQKTVSAALDKFHKELDDVQSKAEEQLQLAHQQQLHKILEQHQQEVSETKKKQWCYNCEAEAIYHCCWNTSYCSVECQQVHWHKEHKRTCRRKR